MPVAEARWVELEVGADAGLGIAERARCRKVDARGRARKRTGWKGLEGK